MPYIGNTIRAADDYRLIDDISSSFNGSTTSFALQVAGSAPVPFPKSPQQVLISVNGVIQEPDPTGASGFNLVGTNIVFSSAPTNGHAFFGIIYATADYLNSGGNFPSGSLGAPSITFVGDEDTGIYRKGSGSVAFVSDSTEIANTDSNGITISSGNLIIPDKIIHNGDTNTAIRFPAADTISFECAGEEVLKINRSSSELLRISGPIDGSTQQEFGIGIAVNDEHTHPAAKITLKEFDASDSRGHLLFYTRGTNNDVASTERLRIDSDGNLLPGTDSQYNIGSNSNRFANGYFDTLYGDGSNLTGINTDLVSDTSPQLGGNLDVNTKNINFGDSSGSSDDRLNFGASTDMSIYHNGTNNIINSAGSGQQLIMQSNNEVRLTGTVARIMDENNSETMAKFSADSSVELYHDNTKVFETISTGAKIQKSGEVNLLLGSTNAGGVYLTLDGDANGDGAGGDYAYLNHNTAGAFRIVNGANSSIDFHTNSTVRWYFYNTGHFVPAANNTYDIGTSSVRVRNIYTNDLNLSNEGGANDVDGTWGSYTIQEGAEDLFLVNKRNGKKYKFNLTEVS